MLFGMKTSCHARPWIKDASGTHSLLHMWLRLHLLRIPMYRTWLRFHRLLHMLFHAWCLRRLIQKITSLWSESMLERTFRRWFRGSSSFAMMHSSARKLIAARKNVGTLLNAVFRNFVRVTRCGVNLMPKEISYLLQVITQTHSFVWLLWILTDVICPNLCMICCFHWWVFYHERVPNGRINTHN